MDFKQQILIKKEIDKLLGLNIKLCAYIYYLVNDNPVNDYDPKKFQEQANKIKKLIDDSFTFQDTREIAFIKKLYKNLEKIQHKIKNFEYNSFQALDEAKVLMYASGDLQNQTIDVINEVSPRSGALFYTLAEFAGINLDDYDLPEQFPDNEDVMAEFDKLPQEFDDLFKIWKDDGKEDEEIEMLIANAFLKIYLEHHYQLLEEVKNYIDKILEALGFFQEFQEESEDELDFEINSNPLLFNLNKEEVAILFNNFFNFNVIDTFASSRYKKLSTLKKIINDTFFFKKGTDFHKIQNINKEFSKIGQTASYPKINITEINLLKFLIEKFQKRIKILEDIENKKK